jgi:hypothetical protein
MLRHDFTNKSLLGKRTIQDRLEQVIEQAAPAGADHQLLSSEL